MAPALNSVRRAVLAAAAEATTVPDLGRTISHHIVPVLPHDGYILVGMDPVTSVGSFLAMENGYGPQTLSRMAIDFALGRSSPLRVLIRGVPDRRYRTQLQNMAAERFDSEIRIELTHRARVWGVLVLLRERRSTSFSPADAAHAEHLTQPVALALKQFVASTLVSSVRSELPPGLIIVGPHDEIKVATRAARDALHAFTPERALNDAELFTTIWDITYRARRSGEPVVCRALTHEGWIALHAQPLNGTMADDVAITTQPTSADVLLPAIAAWHDITPREQAVIDQALEGLSAKQIARRLDLSQHTINDHFKAIYRKIGVTSREALITRLCR